MAAWWKENWEWIVGGMGALVALATFLFGVYKHFSKKKPEDKRPVIENGIAEPTNSGSGQQNNVAGAQYIATGPQHIYHQATPAPQGPFIHPDQPNHSYRVAEAYNEQLNYAKAAEYFIKAAEEYKQTKGPQDLDRARALNSAGIVYWRMAEYTNAIDSYVEALAIFGGKGEPTDKAKTYNNIAGVYSGQGDYDKALEWYNKALAIRESVLGKNHPGTASTYNNIGAVYFKQGEYEKALEWFNKDLHISESVLGKSHPDTAMTYNNIGEVYRTQGDYDKALEWYNKALTIYEAVLGKNHPDTATTYNNIGEVYGKQGEYDMALEWYNKALPILETVLGKNHPDTIMLYNNIANTYEAMGDKAAAAEYRAKAKAAKDPATV